MAGEKTLSVAGGICLVFAFMFGVATFATVMVYICESFRECWMRAGPCALLTLLAVLGVKFL